MPGVGATVLPSDGPGQASVPFIGLVEGLVLAAVRRTGVATRVQPALMALAGAIEVAHPLASRKLVDEGPKRLQTYMEHAPEHEAVAARALLVAGEREPIFADAVQEYLRWIEYAPDGYARVVRLPAYERAEVLADPHRSFGQPIFARGGARVSDVLERFWAGEDLATVSEEFGVPVAELEDVLRVASRRAA